MTKDDDKGFSRVLKGDKCEIAQQESFELGQVLKNDFRLCTMGLCTLTTPSKLKNQFGKYNY